jgi:uncharacterized protein YbaP (TraB family)
MTAVRCIARILAAGCLALLLAPVQVFADPQASASGPPQPQADTAPNRGLFYQVSKGGNTLYLFGTLHVGKPEFYPLNRQVVTALQRSKYLAVEADPSDFSAMARAFADSAMYPPGESLDEHVSFRVMRDLKTVLDTYQLPLEQAQRMRPWTIAMMLDYLGSLKAGYDPAYGADLYLIGVAKDLKKPIAEVESVDFQLQLFAGMTPTEQEAYLADSLHEHVSGEFARQLDEMVAAWSHADTPSIARSLDAGEKQLSPATKPIYTRLIKDRNASMTRRVEEYLLSGSQYFVAVGAGHVLGDDGIVARLKAKGYDVRNLQ